MSGQRQTAVTQLSTCRRAVDTMLAFHVADAQAFPVTHLAVRRVGTDVVSSFVFDDGITEPKGLAVVMSPLVVRSTLELARDIGERSTSLKGAEADELVIPQSYVAARDPVHVHVVTAVVAEDSEAVVLGFRCVDLDETVKAMEFKLHGQIQAKLGPVVVMSAAKFLTWKAELEKAILPKEES